MKTLEICITDFCNLQCKNCGQGTPWHKSKKAMSVDQLFNISKFFKANEFESIKVSGGEPTLHKEFADICNSLKSLFPAKKYYLATNGFNLSKYLNDIKIFDRIDVSCYPGQNDEVFNTLAGLNIQNASFYTKNDDVQMFNINVFSNQNKRKIFNMCSWPRNIYKIVQDRLYPCCIVFGLTQIRVELQQDVENFSVAINENWRENIKKLDIEKACSLCWIDV